MQILSDFFQRKTPANEKVLEKPKWGGSKLPNTLVIPDVILHLIAEYCSDEDIQMLCFISICKHVYNHYKDLGNQFPERYPFRKYLNETTQTERLAEQDKIFETHPQQFIDLLGGYKQIVKIHKVDLKTEDDYLDATVQFPSSISAVRGFDSSHRAFYFAQGTMLDRRHAFVFKYHQRYSNNKSFWVTAATPGQFQEDQLLNGEEVIRHLSQQKIQRHSVFSIFSPQKYKKEEQATKAHAFLARLIKNGEVSYPAVRLEQDGSIPEQNTHIPEENDQNYRAIKLGL